MSRIPTHTLASAPPAARPLLEEVVTLAGGRLLNLHTTMANSPALLASYLGMRRALTEHRTLDPRTGAAVMLTVSAATGGAYSLAVNSQVAMRAGFSAGEVEELRSGTSRDGRLAPLLAVAREAATSGGNVSDATWQVAGAAGWDEAQLAEAFAFIGLAVYVDFYNNYAGTELDVASARGPED